MAKTSKFQGVKTFVSYGPDGKNGDILGMYHNTCVAYKHRDGSVTLNSGGWLTVTTKRRMNQFSNEFCGGRFRVFQVNGQWYVSAQGMPTIEYTDGMTV